MFVYCFVIVLSGVGHSGDGMFPLPGRCLSPFGLRLSGTCPVLTLRSPQTIIYLTTGLEMADVL